MYRALYLLVLCALNVTSLASEGSIRGKKDIRFMDVEYYSRSEVDQLLREAASDDGRIQTLEEVLRPAFLALPKSSGMLSHHAVRYILHRFFLQRHGWLVKGLEPEGAYKTQPEVVKKDWESWVPAYLQQHFDRLEKHQGVSLRDLAEMAAVIEDLVHKESHQQMGKVYEALGFAKNSLLTPEDASFAMDMYLIVVLTARNLTMAEPTKNRQRLMAFRQRYEGYHDMHGFLEDLGRRHFPSDGISFSTMSKVAEAFGEEFPKFNNKECHDLKTTLMKMEGGSRKPGRIPLADFYNSSKYRHWKFTENPEYLRDLGALDDSEPHRPYVILANYISSFNNCIRADSLYAICCRSPCEHLMHSLEEQVAAPSAEAALLAGIVANLSTETVPKRGTLDPKLLQRLDSIAEQNGGSVLLHGRLFAQWMHHAFPRECPYPHEAGTTNPQTPDEWMKTNGRSTQVSPQQMEQIFKDFCPADMREGLPSHCESENEELPWSNHEDREQLLSVSNRPAAKLSVIHKDLPEPTLLLLYLASLPVLALSAYVLDRMLKRRGKLERRCYPSLVPALAFMWATVLCLLTHVVDVKAAAGAGTAFLAWRLVAFRWLHTPAKLVDSHV